jgi:phage-related protein (TIGR01555 family)
MDSFVNFAQKMGVGADNPMTSSTYGFNPITRIRVTLEWMHRGSWLAGVAVDVVADDMTRAGVDLIGDLDPDDMETLQEAAVTLGIENSINDTVKWGRLYGGALAVMMIDGQDMATPLRLDTIGKGQFKGLLVLDRWMVEPSLNQLVTDPGPFIGLPKFYTITADAPALPRAKIHYTRCIRMEGIRLPYWQRLQENLWGISVLERLYDRMIAFDSATTGAAQLVFKSYLRTYKIKDLRQIAAPAARRSTDWRRTPK